VTPAEAAAALGISLQQVHDLCEAGHLRGFAIGDQLTAARRQHLRLLRSSVEALFLERYLAQNGVEFPLVNSAEVTAMRQQLRQQQVPNAKCSMLNPQ
jgi:hypothetical protein